MGKKPENLKIKSKIRINSFDKINFFFLIIRKVNIVHRLSLMVNILMFRVVSSFFILTLPREVDFVFC